MRTGKSAEMPHFCGFRGYTGLSGKSEVAETEGFEPSVPYSQHGGLANRWFQPLTHVSGYLAAIGARYSQPGMTRQALAEPPREMFCLLCARIRPAANGTRFVEHSLFLQAPGILIGLN